MIAKGNIDESAAQHARRLEKALQTCWRDLVAKRKREGRPMVIWRDGRVQHVDPAQLEREADAM